MISKKKLLLPLLLIIISVVVWSVSAQKNMDSLTSEQWSADLTLLKRTGCPLEITTPLHCIYHEIPTITGFIKRDTNAMTAGEPGRSRPNGADNYEPYTLPNSKIGFGVTNKMKDLYPELGDAPFIPVDRPATTTFANYLKGEDPVLKDVLNF